MNIKSRYLGKSQPLSRVSYDTKIKVIQHALGQHHYITKAHGNKTKTINEIKIASVSKNGPEAFLKMITTHELAHFQEKEHNKRFYQLCQHIEPQYHRRGVFSFDVSLKSFHPLLTSPLARGRDWLLPLGDGQGEGAF